MDKPEVITNNVPRALVCFHALPAYVRPDFDYVGENEMDEPWFVEYRGYWYDTHDQQRIVVGDAHSLPMGWGVNVPPEHPFAPYHGVCSESYFSGVLFRFKGEDVICARYYS